MRHECPAAWPHRAAVLIGVLLGILNLFAGGRVLLGLGRPEHPILLPLLLFNTGMGAVYILTALLIRRDARRGRSGAAAVLALNGAVLLILLVRLAGGAVVPGDSIVAMGLRTAVWSVILLLVTRVLRRLREPAPTPVELAGGERTRWIG